MNKLQKLRARLAEVQAELRTLAAVDADELTEEQDTRFAALERELEHSEDGETRGLLADIEVEERRAAVIERADAAGVRATEAGADRGVPNVNVKQGADPYNLRDLSFTASATEIRGRASAAIESTTDLPDRNKEAALALLRRTDKPELLARHLLATGQTSYRTGWQKLVAGAPELIEPEERQALVQARALSLADAGGGYAVPFTLDPTIISTKDITTNPIRRISTVRQIVTNEWNGVSSGGMEFSWDGEAAEVSDDSPVLAQPTIPVHKLQGFALASIEISQDWASIESDLRAMIQEGKDDAEAVAFTTGTGALQPTGIITALDGTASEVAPATAETFAVADLYAVEEALPAKYRLATLDGDTQANRASWIAARATYNSVRKFGTSDSHALWERIGAGLPPRLLGYAAYEASGMRSTSDINTAVTADNLILALGDFRFYVIVDRVGLAVEFIPHLFGANGRPKGQRGWYCHLRVGADSVNDAAFRVLNVATTL